MEPGVPVRGNGSWLPTLRPTLTKWNIIIKAAPREGKEEDVRLLTLPRSTLSRLWRIRFNNLQDIPWNPCYEVNSRII